MEKIITSYNKIAIRSFQSKLILFLFKLEIEGRERFEIDEFHNFRITDELARKLHQKFWKDYDKPLLGRLKILDHWLKSGGLFKHLEYEYICDFFEKTFAREDFKKLEKINKCYYCGITEAQILELIEKNRLFENHFRSIKLKISRKNPNLEYTAANCIKSCYWCNHAKNNEFSEEEFLEVGKSISSIWKNRLKT